MQSKLSLREWSIESLKREKHCRSCAKQTIEPNCESATIPNFHSQINIVKPRQKNSTITFQKCTQYRNKVHNHFQMLHHTIISVRAYFWSRKHILREKISGFFSSNRRIESLDNCTRAKNRNEKYIASKYRIIRFGKKLRRKFRRWKLY